ncbi:uncharacterized protein [Venturia canescens]|uniref:uncharacterized protein n=1 Tax=Venturia canescens TaxID=32260 RepID=UPI001C9CC87C|nr:uncharacterized protein LOC122419502 [Venturia canescens]
MASRLVLVFGLLLVFGIVGANSAPIDEVVSDDSLELVPYPYSLENVVVSADTTVQRLKKRDAPRQGDIKDWFAQRQQPLQHPQPHVLVQQGLQQFVAQQQPQGLRNPGRRAPGRA